jgi:hypothetical protein
VLALSWLADVALFAADNIPEPVPTPSDLPNAAAVSEPPGSLPVEDPKATPGNIVRFDEPPSGNVLGDEYDDGWAWQWVPTGLIYHSYMAGPHEPRAGLFGFSDLDGNAFADATLGGRMGFLQYGNGDPVHPAGFQLDFYGAAIARLDLKSQEDLVASDYVFGFPLTYGNERWQMKLGYAHLSSHLGDEFAISHPGSLNDRINYSRDSMVWGNSYYPAPVWRVYGEVGWAVRRDDHAGRWTSQFGTEVSRPGPTGPKPTPFLAINGRLRDDDRDLMGDLNIQTGWLRRGILGQTLRYGFDYYNGKSDQSQFFNKFEQQIGAGVWYDF